MIPLAGDWTGTGRDGVGLYDRRDGRFRLRDSLRAGPANFNVSFGPARMVPVTGNWGQ